MRKHKPPIRIDRSSMPEAPRRRLYRQYRKLGSFRAVATLHNVNVRYVYDYIRFGTIPKNKYARHALGIPRAYGHPVSVNELLQKPIQEQPPEVLRLALEYRTDFFPPEELK